MLLQEILMPKCFQLIHVRSCQHDNPDEPALMSHL